jgi:hypothetical protein
MVRSWRKAKSEVGAILQQCHDLDRGESEAIRLRARQAGRSTGRDKKGTGLRKPRVRSPFSQRLSGGLSDSQLFLIAGQENGPQTLTRIAVRAYSTWKGSHWKAGAKAPPKRDDNPSIAHRSSSNQVDTDETRKEAKKSTPDRG